MKQAKTSERRKKKKTIVIKKTKAVVMSLNDYDAKRQGFAIRRMNGIGPVQASRINFTYEVDGFIFNTGKKHRKIG